MFSPKVQNMIFEWHGKYELPTHSALGNQPIYYIDHLDNFLCAECAWSFQDDPEVNIVNYEINWDEEDLICNECGETLDWAYSMDEDDEDEGEEEEEEEPLL